MNLCPYCNEDRDIDMTDVKKLCNQHNLDSEYVNPGGRELHFKDRGRLLLSDQCNSCDTKKIKTFLGVI